MARPGVPESWEEIQRRSRERRGAQEGAPPPAEGVEVEGVEGETPASPDLPEDSPIGKMVKEGRLPTETIIMEGGEERVGTNIAKMHHTLYQEARKKREAEFRDKAKGYEATATDQAEISRAAREDADYELQRYEQASRGHVLIGSVGEDRTAEIMELPIWARPFAAVWSPKTYRIGSGPLPSEVKSEGTLSKIFRTGPLTFTAAMLKSGGGMDDPETIEALRSGVDIFHALPELGEIVTGADADQSTKETAGLALAIPLMLFEPDLITLAVLGPGAVAAKGARVSYGLSKLAKTEKKLRALEGMVAEGALTPHQLSARLSKDLGPEVASVFQAGVASRVGVKGDVASRIKRLSDSAADAQNAAEDAARAAQGATDVAKKAELEKEAGKLRHEAMERAYQSYLFLEKDLEAQREALLAVFRVPGVKTAEGITKTKTLKQLAAIPKRLERSLPKWEKELALLKKGGAKKNAAQIEKLEKVIQFAKKTLDDPQSLGGLASIISRADAAKVGRKVFEKHYKAVGKEVGLLTKTAEDALTAVTGMTEDALKKQKFLEKTALAQRAPREILREMADGLQSFRKDAAADYGTLKAVVTKPWKELTDLGKSSDIARVNAMATALRSKKIQKVAGRGKEIDVDEFSKALGEKGREFLASDAGKAFRESEVGRPIAEVLGVEGKAFVPLEKLGAFEESIDELARGIEQARVTDPSQMWARLLLDERRNLDLTPKGIWAKAGRLWDRTKRSFGPLGLKLGEYSDDVVAEVKHTYAVADTGATEFGELLQKNGSDWEWILPYLDDGDAVALKEGVSKFERITGPGSTYEKGKYHILNDTRQTAQSARKEELLSTEIAVLNGALSHEKDEIIRNLIALGEAVDNAAAEKIFTQMERRLGKLSKAQRAAAGREETSKPLLALARMWLPKGVKTTPQQAAILRALALKNLEDSENYVQFAEKMRRATLGIVGGADNRLGRVHVIGANAFMGGVVEGYMAQRFSRLVQGKLTPTVAADMSRLLAGEYDRVEEWDKAVEVLTLLGMPVSQKTVTRPTGVAKEMVETTKELVRFGSTREGEAIFVPRNIVKEMEGRGERYVKSLEATKPAERAFPGIGRLRRGTAIYADLWKTSIVTGLGIPNPRYWTNNIFGDFSQMWIEEGIGTSSRLSFQNFLPNVPGVGRKWHETLLARAERNPFGRKGTEPELLPYVMETMFNPNLGRVFQGKSGHFMTKEGRFIDFDTLRKWGVEDGITDSFVQEEFLELMTRASGQTQGLFAPLKRVGKKWQQDIYDHATLVQQRQRMAFYASLLQKGVPRSEAKRRTLNALYDWKFALSESETQILTRVIPFYRFWKLSLRQAAGSVAEPLTRSSAQTWKRAWVGQNQFGRVRQQAFLAQGMPDYFFDENPDEEMQRRIIYHNIAKEFYPEWMDTRPLAGFYPMEQYAQEYWRDETKRKYSHYAYLLPPLTALDSMDMMTSMLGGLFWATSRGALATGLLDPRDDPFVADAEARLFEPMLGSLYAPFEGLFRSFAVQNGMDLNYQVQTGYVGLSRDDANILRDFPLTRGLISTDPDTGRDQINRAHYALIKMAPFFATQLPTFWAAGNLNPEWQKGAAQGPAYMFRKITRLPVPRLLDEGVSRRAFGKAGLEYPVAPSREVKRQLQQVERKFRDRPTREALKLPSTDVIREERRKREKE